MNQISDVTQDKNEQAVHANSVTHLTDDQRLKPKPRKHPKLWQLYLLQQELVEFRKRHLLRLSSAERGVSNLIPDFEQFIIDEFNLDQHVDPKNKAQREGGTDRQDNVYEGPSFFSQMVLAGQAVGPIWDWLLEHKGIGPSLAAKTLALIDDIGKFDTIAKLWRYSGYGLNDYWCDEKGKAVCPAEGWKWVAVTPKARYRIWTVIRDQHSYVTHSLNVNSNDQPPYETQQNFVKSSDQQPNVTPVGNVNSNSQLYHETQNTNAIPEEKQWAIPQNIDLSPLERVDFLEPDPSWTLKKLSDRLCKGYHAPYNTPLRSTLYLIANEQFNKANTIPYKDMYVFEKERLMNERGIKRGHAHNMAWRKVKKEFLKQLWLAWRRFEGLPISEEY